MQASCPHCEAPLNCRPKFCPECGGKLEATKFCQECGAKMSPNAKFCGECGAKTE
ncbi:MAG: zinc ribbon domain-containing protein [Chloroflexi bacterium]|nr:zinc ribbon domain-containing protein [Chloroflexota bacterium]